MESPDIESLVRLLDDPSSTVQEHLKQRFSELGREALPGLHEELDGASPEDQMRIRKKAHDIHVETLFPLWESVISKPDEDQLERGTFLLSLYRDPLLDIQAYRARLDRMADAFTTRHGQTGGLEGVMTLADFIRETLGYGVRTVELAEMDDYCFATFIDERRGSALLFAIFFLLLSGRVGLTVNVIRLPDQILLRYSEGNREIYLKPSETERLVKREDCINHLMQHDTEDRYRYLAPISNSGMLLLQTRALHAIAKESEQSRAADDLETMLHMAEALPAREE